MAPHWQPPATGNSGSVTNGPSPRKARHHSLAVRPGRWLNCHYDAFPDFPCRAGIRRPRNSLRRPLARLCRHHRGRDIRPAGLQLRRPPAAPRSARRPLAGEPRDCRGNLPAAHAREDRGRRLRQGHRGLRGWLSTGPDLHPRRRTGLCGARAGRSPQPALHVLDHRGRRGHVQGRGLPNRLRQPERGSLLGGPRPRLSPRPLRKYIAVTHSTPLMQQALAASGRVRLLHHLCPLARDAGCREGGGRRRCHTRRRFGLSGRRPRRLTRRRRRAARQPASPTASRCSR